MADDKWKQPEAPPPPMFTGQKEKDLVKAVNDELIEKVIGQSILYYPISIKDTNYHPLYGEAIVKNFQPPVRVHVLIEWDDYTTTTNNFGIDRIATMTVKFHRRRLTEDQDLFVKEGDFVKYEDHFYEIVELKEPSRLFGQDKEIFEINAICRKAREGTFNAK